MSKFDPDELVRWAESYGHPEEWAKKSQSLHVENEKLREQAGRLCVGERFGDWVDFLNRLDAVIRERYCLTTRTSQPRRVTLEEVARRAAL